MNIDVNNASDVGVASNMVNMLDESFDYDNCELSPLLDDSEDTKISDSYQNTVEKKSTVPTSTMKYKYAPVITPVKGNYNLYCIALVWNDNPGAGLSKVRSAGAQTADIYRNLSNGNLNFNVIAKSVKVNFDCNAKNLSAAESQAKKIAVAGQKNDDPNVFIIVNNGAKKVSNGSGDTAHVLGTLVRDFLHELGHCRPTVLGHSGKYLENGKYEQYGDGTSFMSSLNSHKLTAPQLYVEGWFPENKVAEYEWGSVSVDYIIDSLDTPNTGDNLKAVLIPREGKSPLFLSMPTVDGKRLLALHCPYGSKPGSLGHGSQRILVFSNSAEYEGLSFVKINEADDCCTVRVTPKPPKP